MIVWLASRICWRRYEVRSTSSSTSLAATTNERRRSHKELLRPRSLFRLWLLHARTLNARLRQLAKPPRDNAQKSKLVKVSDRWLRPLRYQALRGPAAG